MGHTLTNVLVHVVFTTKNREKVLTAAVRKRLHAYLARAIEHLHLLLRPPDKILLADLVRKAKSNSSPWLHCELLTNFAWKEGYSAFSVSQSQRDAVSHHPPTQTNTTPDNH